MILAIVLSMVVLFGWQFFVAGPQLERRPAAGRRSPQAAAGRGRCAWPAGAAARQARRRAGGRCQRPPGSFADRDAALAATQRVTIDTADLCWLDQSHRRASRRPAAQAVSRDGRRQFADHHAADAGRRPNGYFAEQGWVPAAGTAIAVPDADRLDRRRRQPTLTATTPVTLLWDNGAGLIFRRTFAVDEHYLFTVTQTIENNDRGRRGAVPLCPRRPPRHAPGRQLLHPA